MEPSVGELISLSVERLTSSDSARLDVELILANILGRNRTWLFTWPDYQLSSEQLKAFEELLQQREAGKPIAYILGRREFWGLELECNEHSLIPRPETELLVEIALGLNLPTDARVLDLGTGTGAITLALVKERQNWQLTAVDLIPEAVELAKRNAANLNAVSVNWQQGAWFEPVPEDEYFDLIVSNPPYVEEDSPFLTEGDVRFEPQSALTSGSEGMDDIHQIIDQARDYVVTGGRLLLEHGFEQAALVRSALEGAGYSEIETHQDLAGLDRATLATFAQKL